MPAFAGGNEEPGIRVTTSRSWICFLDSEGDTGKISGITKRKVSLRQVHLLGVIDGFCWVGVFCEQGGQQFESTCLRHGKHRLRRVLQL